MQIAGCAREPTAELAIALREESTDGHVGRRVAIGHLGEGSVVAKYAVLPHFEAEEEVAVVAMRTLTSVLMRGEQSKRRVQAETRNARRINCWLSLTSLVGLGGSADQ